MSVQRSNLIQHITPQGELCDADRSALKASIVAPPALQAALEANPIMAQTLHQVVSGAIEMSLEHPDTKMRVLSGAEITRRGQICMEAMRIAYCEQHLSLHQCYYILPKVLINSLRRGQRMDDITASERQGRYSRDLPKEVCEVDEGVDLTNGLEAPLADGDGPAGKVVDD